MSATNETSTIGLSQYISTDKPTYLTDYNGDMLKIDNAIAADRDSISTAQNKANTADGKADANKLSIDTLNTQINGDPTVPSDTGLAGKVTDNSGDIDTIEALLGNGTPTTSNQTVIGAINGLEGAIAPREDGDNLANSYSIGDQFARGGSVYTALVPLTAGTAFASLTLNTDYKNSDTLVEQISNINDRLQEGYEILVEDYVIASVTADGVKTYSQLLTELALAVVSAANALPTSNEFIETKSYLEDNFGYARLRTDKLLFKDATSFDSEWNYTYAALDAPNAGDIGITVFYGNLDSSGTYSKRGLVAVSKPSGSSVDMTGSDLSSIAVPIDTTISIVGNRYIKV